MTSYASRQPRASVFIADECEIMDAESMVFPEFDDDGIEPTGLLDAEGVPIYRMRERVRCGYIDGDDE